MFLGTLKKASAVATHIMVAGVLALLFVSHVQAGDTFPDPASLSFVDRVKEPVRTLRGDLNTNREWLAQAIYFEARGESAANQRKVADVVLNRVASPSHPNTIEGVVREGEGRLHRCQFSYRCDGKKEIVTDMEAWTTSVMIAVKAIRDWEEGKDMGCPLYYRANYTSSKKALRWFATLKKEGQFGTHIFYCDP